MAGAVVWLTGLSGAGKTTLAHAVAKKLSCPYEIMDGDEIREFLSRGPRVLAKRIATPTRIASASSRACSRSTACSCSWRRSRRIATRAPSSRRSSSEAGHEFVEVYVHAPLETVAERDVKGLYKKALAGQDRPLHRCERSVRAAGASRADVHTHVESLEESAARLIAVLHARGLA